MEVLICVIMSCIAIFISVFSLLLHFKYIVIKPKDKYAAYRDPETGLLRGKRDG